MVWLKNNFNMWHDSGLTIFGAACFTFLCILFLPYLKYKDWQYDRLPEDQKGFGKFGESERDIHNVVRRQK